MSQKDMALSLCRKWNIIKKNTGLKNLRNLMDQHNKILKMILLDIEKGYWNKLKEDLEDAINIYRIEGTVEEK